MRLTVLCLMTSLCLSGVSHAQDTTKQKAPEAPANAANPATEKLIQDGLQAYHKGDRQVAVEKLQQAINKIQQEGERNLVDFLPKVEGWKADEPSSSSGSWGAGEEAFQWSEADCTYRSGDQEVKVTITNSPLLVQPQKMLLSNPQIINMMNMDPNQTVKSFESNGWSGYKLVEKGQRGNVVALAGKLMVTIETSKDDMALLERFLAAMDFAGLQKAGK